MKFFYPLTIHVVKAFFKLFYRHKVFGLKHIPDGGAIIAPNHVSFYDPPIVAISCPDEVFFLAAKFLFRIPILAFLIRRLNALPLSGSPRDFSSIKSICHFLKEEKKVVIFPEGLRTYDGKLAPVKPGIAMLSLRANVPIIPAYIHGAFEIWPRDRWFPKLRGETICAFGRPIYPNQFQHLENKAAKQAMAISVQDAI